MLYDSENGVMRYHGNEKDHPHRHYIRDEDRQDDEHRRRRHRCRQVRSSADAVAMSGSRKPRRTREIAGRSTGTSTEESDNDPTKTLRSPSPSSSSWKPRSKFNMAIVLGIAAVVAVLHRNHLTGMFDHDRRFSRLSPLQQELTFRTEMGLYYSYYKTIVVAPSFLDGLGQLIADNVTEFPSTINTLKRFNLYPEVVLGAAYRIYAAMAGALYCATDRGDVCSNRTKLTLVEGAPNSYDVNMDYLPADTCPCSGFVEPSIFYVQCVFLLNGLSAGILFLFGTHLSGSVVGGLVTAMAFFYNHGECTRVQWTPPLRESFAYPFFLVQMFAVSYALRSKAPTKINLVVIAVASACFMLSWQFSQFALLTQTMALFLVYCLDVIGSKQVLFIISGQLTGLMVSAVLLFGNEMLITSYLAASIVSVLITLQCESILAKIRPTCIAASCRVLLMSILTLVIKNLMSRRFGVTDDAHVYDLLRSKLFGINNFHTMLYICAPEFDFIERGTLARVSRTFLAPYAVVVIATAAFTVVRHKYYAKPVIEPVPSSSCSSPICSLVPLNQLSNRDETIVQRNSNGCHGDCQLAIGAGQHIGCDGNGFYGNGLANRYVEDANHNAEAVTYDGGKDINVKRTSRRRNDAEIAYHSIQLAAFTFMSFGVMRLKLFWTPHMCLMTSLLASRHLFSWVGSPNRHYTLLFVVMATMSFQGIANVQQQRTSVRPEFDSEPVEELVHWINRYTGPNTVFAGPMPTMATIKLCTGRPIVNHPHYEDAGLRARTKLVYTLYSRKPDFEVWNNLRQLRVDYVLLERWWCLYRSKPGCSLPEVWDIEEERDRGRPSTCSRLFTHPQPYFRLVHRNCAMDVLRVVEKPYM